MAHQRLLIQRQMLQQRLPFNTHLPVLTRALHLFLDCVSVKVISDNKGELCNGDTVRVRIKYDKNQLKKYDLDLEDEVFEVKVSGLGKDNNKKASKKKHSVDDVIDMHDWDF